MGSPDFALPSLRALVNSYQVVGVVTQPDRASGRGKELKAPPVKSLAFELNIPVTQPEKLRAPEAMEQLQKWNPDVIVVAAYGQILKQDVLNVPRFGCINVHASLLPRWRGAAPVNAAILAGDEDTGVTIMKMEAGLDTGPMYAKKSMRLMPNDTTGSVLQTLSTLGADLLIKTLPEIISGHLSPAPQPGENATYAPMLKKEDGRLDFFSQTADELERRVRAMNPWPGAWMELNDSSLLKVHRARVGQKNGQAGQRFIEQNQPAVYARSGFLFLDEVQPAGKKPMDGKSFLAGSRDW